MCSIAGGTLPLYHKIAAHVWEASRDRGRDDHGVQTLHSLGVWIGNRRATPTTESETPSHRQPVGEGPWFVFNGTIANDWALGAKKGEVDTSVLPRVLRTDSLLSFRDSLQVLEGSFAIAAMRPDGEIFLGTNYKPIFWTDTSEGRVFSSLRHHFPEGPLREGAHEVPPYSVIQLSDPFRGLRLPRTQKQRAVVIASGGLDSTVAACEARSHHPGLHDLHLLHFRYGCRAEFQELRSVEILGRHLGAPVHVVDVPSLVFSSSSLVDTKKKVASGLEGAEWAHDWVPARNLVFLSLASAWAENYGAGFIYLGTNLEEGGAYPDNEEQFLRDFERTLVRGVQNGTRISIRTPLGGLTKKEIVARGLELGAPLEFSWSCYHEGPGHCGDCGPCFMRREAFRRNGMEDPSP